MRNAVPDVGDAALPEEPDEVERLMNAVVEVARRTQGIDPSVREIVREAGLSNQVFYRHFKSKDALLYAVLERGQVMLSETVTRRMAEAADPEAAVRAWVTAILRQAQRPRSREHTRPFVVNGPRLADRFPEMSRRHQVALAAPLNGAIQALGGTLLETRYVYLLTLGTMHNVMVYNEHLSDDEVAYVASFAVGAIEAAVARRARDGRDGAGPTA